MNKRSMRAWYAKTIGASLARAKRTARVVDTEHERYAAAQERADRHHAARDEANAYRKETLAFVHAKLKEAAADGIELPKLQALWNELTERG